MNYNAYFCVNKFNFIDMCGDYSMMMVSDIMFVETKECKFQKTSKGIVLDGGKAYYIGGTVKFNGDVYEITSVPGVETVGANNWVKITFSTKVV